MNQVLGLSNRLREWGIDCRLDQYENSPAEGWARWSSRQIEEADFVLIVCTPTYYSRYSGREEKGTGKGAKWEGAVITQELYELEGINTKYLPVIFSPDCHQNIVRELRQATAYDVSLEESFEQLYRQLTNQPSQLMPELGSIRSLPPRSRKQTFRPTKGHLTFIGESSKKVPYYLVICALVLIGLFSIYRFHSSDTTTDKKKWEQAIQILESRLSGTRYPDDGYGDRLPSTNVSDNWTTAQVLAGLLAAGVSSNDVNLKASFQYLMKHQEVGGWSRREDSMSPSTEVTSWVGLAGILSLRRSDIWGASQEEAKRMVQYVYDEVTMRQTGTGGWSTFRYYDRNHKLNTGPYASVMALVFLLQMENTEVKWVGDESRLKDQIRRGLDWIIDTYNESVQGWEEQPGSGLVHELTTYNLLLLTQAKRQGFRHIEVNPKYRQARLAWLKTHSSDISHVITDGKIKQMQVVNENGKPVTKNYAVTLMRYPWALLLATILGDDSSLPEEERNLALSASPALWSRLDDTIKSVSTGFTYTAAENLLCLGWIGQHYHWIGNHDWGKPALPAVTAVN